MSHRNVLVMCASLTIDDPTALHVINKLTEQARVHLLTRNNFGASPAPHPNAPVDPNATQDTTLTVVPTPTPLLATPENVTCYAATSHGRGTVCRAYAELGCVAYVHVNRDFDNLIALDTKLPMLSVLVQTISHDTLSRRVRATAAGFSVVVATGLHTQDVLRCSLPDALTTTIFPRFRSLLFEGVPTAQARLNYQIAPDRFVMYVDINTYIELKGFDVIVQAYSLLLRTRPDFAAKALLLINANPGNVMLNNVLAVEKFTREHVNITPQYYNDGTRNEEQFLHNGIVAADVVLDPTTGGDFDANVFLAQQYGKPVVYTDIMRNGEYVFHGVPLKRTQRFYDGMGHGVLFLPNVEELAETMLACYGAWAAGAYASGPSRDARAAMAAFRAERDTFDDRWEALLRGIV